METDAQPLLREIYAFLAVCFALVLVCVGSSMYNNYRREQALARVLEAIEKRFTDDVIVVDEDVSDDYSADEEGGGDEIEHVGAKEE